MDSKPEIRKIKLEARKMMATCFWKESHYWSNKKTPSQKGYSKIRISQFKTINWFGINLYKYNPELTEAFKQLPSTERFFYQVNTANKHSRFKVWACHAKHFEKIITQIYDYPEIEIEFIISPNPKGLIVPELFKPLNLDFYEHIPRWKGNAYC